MKKIYLTYDMEWANDELLEWFLVECEEKEVYGTINVTHPTGMIDLYRKSGIFELGIHPNFNSLLEGQNSFDYITIIKNLKRIVPEAKVVRSHSLVKSNRISNEFKCQGLSHESNIFIDPFTVGNVIAFKDSMGIIQVPIIFEDDLYMASEKKSVDEYLLLAGEYLVFNFHPIHLLLNSEDMNRYNKAKIYNNNNQLLKEYRNLESYGIYDFWHELIVKAKECGYEFGVLGEIQPR